MSEKSNSVVFMEAYQHDLIVIYDESSEIIFGAASVDDFEDGRIELRQGNEVLIITTRDIVSISGNKVRISHFSAYYPNGD